MNWDINKEFDCIKIKVDYKPSKVWEQWFLLSSDRHIDNTKTDLKLQKYHLDQALERKAIVLDFGDLFDAMQGKNDRRSAKSDLREDNKTNNYINSLVDYAVDFFQPYKSIMAVLGEGNHETGITKHCEYNLTDGLVRDLSRMGSPVIKGGYRGWIKIMFEVEGNLGKSKTFNLYYTHGHGGNSPMTKGVLNVVRRAAFLPDADIVVSGHIHEDWIMPLERSRLTTKGVEVSDTQYHVQLPTYKEEFIGKSGGFHHEKGGVPKPIGARWARFYYSPRSRRVEVEFMRTQK